MSKVILLKELKAFTLDVTRDLIFPVAQQKEDKEPPKPRAAPVCPTANRQRKRLPTFCISSSMIRPSSPRISG